MNWIWVILHVGAMTAEQISALETAAPGLGTNQSPATIRYSGDRSLALVCLPDTLAAQLPGQSIERVIGTSEQAMAIIVPPVWPHDDDPA